MSDNEDPFAEKEETTEKKTEQEDEEEELDLEVAAGSHKFDADEEQFEELSIQKAESDLIKLAVSDKSLMRQCLRRLVNERRPQFVDIFSEFGGNSFAIIDGDALLSMALADPTLDSTHGGQPLHVSYNFMRFLDSMERRDARYSVVFFKRNALAWETPHRVMRECLIAHLKSQTSMSVHDEFYDCFDASFEQILKESLPSFVMTRLAAVEEDHLHQFEVMALAMSVHLMDQGVPVVNMSPTELEFRGPHLYGFVAEPFPRAMAKDSLNICRDILGTLGVAENIHMDVSQAALHILANGNPRLAVVHEALRAAVHDAKGDSMLSSSVRNNLMRAFALHVCYLDILPLRSRAFAVPSADHGVPELASLDVFLRELMPHLEASIRAMAHISNGDGLADLWDVRLLVQVLGQAALCPPSSPADLGLPQAVDGHFHTLTGLCGGPLPLCSAPNWSDTERESFAASLKPSLERQSDESTMELCPASEDTFVQKLVGQDLLQAVKPLESPDLGAANWGQQQHWHSNAVGQEGDHLESVMAKIRTEPYDNLQKMHELFFREAFHMQKRRAQELEATVVRLLAPVYEDYPSYAQELEHFYRKGDFQAVQKLLRRRGKYNPARQADLTQARLVSYSQSLIGGPIQPFVITQEAQQQAGASTRQTRQAQSHHGRGQVTVSKAELMKLENYHKDREELLANVQASLAGMKEKAKDQAHKRLFTEAWKTVDDFCNRWKKSFDTKKADFTESVQPIVERLSAEQRLKGDTVIKAKAVCDSIQTINVLGNLRLHLLQATCHRLLAVTLPWWAESAEALRHDASETDIDNELFAASILLSDTLDLLRDIQASASKYSLAADKTKPLVENALTVVVKAGFRDDAELVASHYNLPADFTKVDAKALVDRADESFAHFQLKVMGAFFPRRPSPADARTHGHFNPDPWQRKLLDVVDSHHSAVVSAPTSSGKTFISFYAMEQVLREGTDGVIVYVSPTKALVNQVEAEIHARFNKSYDHGGTTLCGVFTAEYRRQEDTCQILVTVPECLEMLLLDVNKAQWAHKLRWVIFDEVHRISMQEGHIWERLLIAIDAPFLALSATIGNPDAIEHWLGNVERARERELTVIVHKHRFNDVKPYVYDTNTHGIRPVNPAMFLTAEGLVSMGFPPEMKLLPEHSSEITDLMALCQPTLQSRLELLQKLADRVEGATTNLEGGASITAFDETLLDVVRQFADVNAKHAQDLLHHLGSAHPNNDICQTIADLRETTKLARLPLERDAAVDLQRVVLGDIRSAATLYETTISHVTTVVADRDFTKKHPVVDSQVSVDFEASTQAALLSTAKADGSLLESQVLAALQRQFSDVGFGKDFRELTKTTELLDFLFKIDSHKEEAQRLLPAILFHLSPTGCEHIVSSLTKQLDARQIISEIDTYCKHRMSSKQLDTKELEVCTSFLHDDTWRQFAMHVLVPEVRPPPGDYDTHHLTDAINTLKLRKDAYFAEKLQQILEHNRKERDEYEKFRRKNKGTRPEDFGVNYINSKPWKEGYIDPRFCLVPEAVTPKAIKIVNNNKPIRNVKNIFIRSIMRGIGLHHPELPRPYKNTVERLFRKKAIRVVVATSTLSLGINMPCRTAVILGDSRQLNPQEFLQMSGRAGRRSFDRRGYVVLFGVPRPKVTRLFTAPLPSLVGNVPVSAELILRLVHRFKSLGEAEEPVTLAMAERLLSHPFFVRSDDTAKKQLHLLTRFVVEYLVEQRALELRNKAASPAADASPDGTGAGKEAAGAGQGSSAKSDDVPDAWDEDEEDQEEDVPDAWDEDVPDEWDASDDETDAQADPDQPSQGEAQPASAQSEAGATSQKTADITMVETNLSSLLNHLYFMAPFNFLFVLLLENNVFDKVCDEFAENEEERNKALLALLCHVFHPIPVSETQQIEPGCPCKVVLDPLPTDVQAIVEAHNRRSLDVFVAFAHVCSQLGLLRQTSAQQAAGEEQPFDASAVLPGTRPGAGHRDVTEAPTHGLAGAVASASMHGLLQAPQVCVSGRGDVFSNPSEVVRALGGAHIDARAIPYFESSDVRLNAYAYDFFIHEDARKLARFNGLRLSGLYDTLKTFLVQLRVVTDALARRVTSDGERQVAAAFNALKDEFALKFNRVFSF